jgi:Raf kinase inhibitor-like YbhB/YbcL family protein
MSTKENGMKVYSTAFSHNGHIPPRYTCEGENINPPLEIGNIPEEAKTLAIIVEDHDASKSNFVHWLVWNISPNEAIAEKSNPGISGTNDFGKTGYGGPCPPSGSHRYFFTVFALDIGLDLLIGADKNDLMDAMRGHIVDKAELMGHYQKRKVMAS